MSSVLNAASKELSSRRIAGVEWMTYRRGVLYAPFRKYSAPSLCTQLAHPNPLADRPGSCAAPDPSIVCDKTELSLQIRVPTNAQSFS